MKRGFIIFLLVTITLMISSFFRWSELETISTSTPGVELTYTKDHWVGQAWVEYCPPSAICKKNYEVPLVTETNRHHSFEALIQEHSKHGQSGFLVEAWRKRDLATYIWLNLTTISFIGVLYTFRSYTRRK